ncbi:MAG: NUDIX domain-containing protein [Actinobacteria bacterium]|nr:NUDIX domain-containing protein [Actinomycetota bacterium]
MTNEPQLQVPLDGLFLSPTPPWGASVLVLRERTDVLLLRRDGQWSPPAVTRLPDEPAAACAARALEEIAGLTLALWPVAEADPAWAVFVATANDSPLVRPGNGYDRHEWVPIDAARDRCTDLVSTTLGLVA